MPRIIKKDRGNYTNISNQLVRDDRLSWKARGIFLYLWSQADNWKFHVNEIATHATDGRRSLQSGLAELEKYDYLKRVSSVDEHGDFDGMDWYLNDKPEPVVENGIKHITDKKPQKNVQNASDAKCIRREMHPTQNVPLRNNNNKNYQLEELTKERKEIYSSPAKQNEPRIPYKQIIDYLNKKTGAHYKPSSKKNQQLIHARWNEGYKLEDFKQVIDNKAYSWQNSDMWKYMRPETLFGTKFEGYLNENDLKQFNKNKSTDPFAGLPTNNNSTDDSSFDGDLPF